MRPSESVSARSVRLRLQLRLEAVLTARHGSGRARTVANRAETALTGAVRTGLRSRRRYLRMHGARPAVIMAALKRRFPRRTSSAARTAAPAAAVIVRDQHGVCV